MSKLSALFLRRIIFYVFLLSIIVFVFSCASVPYTNRTRLMMISEQEEIRLGEEAFAQLMKKEKLNEDVQVQNTKASELIKKVGEKISAVAENQEYDWEFVLIDGSSTINAFCLPGGKVAFYTGILPLCEDENGIAVVMGHEIAHAVARHGAERMSQGILAKEVGNGLAKVLGEKEDSKKTLILTAYGLGAKLGVMLPFSRKHEYEADYIGIILMAKAGYDPSYAVTFWTKMMELSKGKSIPEFLSTHPSDEKRIEELNKRLPEAMGYYK